MYVVICTCTGQFAEGSMYYYYGERSRYPSQKLQLTPDFLSSVDILDQEERVCQAESYAKELGFKGTTILHQFHKLYGVDLTRDFVIDAQHLQLLGVVKHDFHLMFEEPDDPDVENPTRARKLKVLSEKLATFPWTRGMFVINANQLVYDTIVSHIHAEMKSSRIPRNVFHTGFRRG